MLRRAWNRLVGPSKTDLAISTLDAIAFVALHGKVEDRFVALRAYRAFQREAKAGRLNELERQMWAIADAVSKEFEQETAAREGL